MCPTDERRRSPNFSAIESAEATTIFYFADRLSGIINAPLFGVPVTKPHYMNAELLEAYSWLHFGVDIGYFSPHFARRFFYEFAPSFLKAFAEAKENQETFDLWFPSNLRTMWEAEFLGRTPLFSFARVWNQGEAPEKLQCAFQSIFALSNECASNPEANLLVYSILQATDVQWSEAVAKNRPYVNIQAETGINLPDMHWAHAGVLSLVEYMHAFRQLKSDVQESLKELKLDSQTYFDRFRQIQQWRLNFGSYRYRMRFLEVALKAATALMPESPQQSFATALDALLTDWGAPKAQASTA